MTNRVVKPKPKTLVQQQADFTAEGSPPPGKVGGSVQAPARRAASNRAALPSEARSRAKTGT